MLEPAAVVGPQGQSESVRPAKRISNLKVPVYQVYVQEPQHWTKFLFAVVGSLTYILSFYLLYNSHPIGVIALTAIPVFVVAWLWGMVAGLSSSILVFFLNAALFYWLGSTFWMIFLGGGGSLVSIVIVLAATGIGLLRDLSFRLQQNLKDLHHNQSRLYQMAAAAEFAGEGVEITDLDGRFEYVNPAFEQLTGYSFEDVIGQTPSVLLRSGMHEPAFYEEMWDTVISGQVWRGEVISRCKDGSLRHFAMTLSPVCDEQGKIQNLLAIKRDVTERKKNEERLRHEALHDVLTGLPNRQLLQDRIQHCMQRLLRHPEQIFAVLFLDLDRFKNINDSFGHAVGDELLLQCSQRLQDSVRSEDTVARLGGDEFVVLLEQIEGEGYASRVAQRIQLALAQPFVLAGGEYIITSSIGIVIGNNNYVSPDELIRDADNAMYRAKELGRDQSVVFQPNMLVSVSNLLRLENDLRLALQRDEFVVYYQPVLGVTQLHIAGVEALLRWQHPTRGLLEPSEFIDVAEDTGLIVPIGEWVLREACLQILAWYKLWPAHFRPTLSVNLSARQLTQMDLAERLLSIIRDTGMETDKLKLEITEGVLFDDFDLSASILHRFKQEGIRILMDDFGTGYSSLNYLYRFPFDCVKIDRTFLANIEHDDKVAELVRFVIMLSHSFAMDVVAEGVENVGQLDILRSFQCNYAQGFHFSEPIPHEKMLAFVKQMGFLPSRDSQ